MEETPQEEKSNPLTPLGTSPLKQIRTFQGDVASALQGQRESLYSIQETEKLKRASGGTVLDTSPDNSPKMGQFFLLFFGSFFLIGLGLVGAWVAYDQFLKKTAPPVLALPDNRFIAPQKSVDVDLAGASRDTLFSAVTSASAEASPDELRHLVLREGVGEGAPLTTTAQFFSIIQSSAPGSLVRALDPLFMVGAIGQSRFIIFKLSSFENAFAGMLTWEPNMALDLGPLFATAPLLTNNGSTSVFKDTVSQNKDVRALYAPISAGSTTTAPALLYSFFGNQKLIITDSLDTLHTLLDRLTQASLIH